MTASNRENQHVDEAQIAAMLRQVGARPQPDAMVMAAAHAEVRRAWLAGVDASRRRRRRRLSLAAAAGFLLTLGVSLQLFYPSDTVDRAVAQSLDVKAQLEFRRAGAVADDVWQSLAPGHKLLPGDGVRTSTHGYGSLALTSGVDLRMDRDTQLELLENDEVLLQRGAIYVEAPGPSTLAVRTVHGIARDIGTRFEVRLDDASWQVQVRDGKVIVEDRVAGEAIADAGERLRVSGRDFSREPVGRADASWRWTHAALRPMAIEGATLDAYLAWWAREMGLRVSFREPIDEAIAAQTRLHGSLEGLTLEQGLEAVVAGAGYRVVDRDSTEVILTR